MNGIDNHDEDVQEIEGKIIQFKVVLISLFYSNHIVSVGNASTLPSTSSRRDDNKTKETRTQCLTSNSQPPLYSLQYVIFGFFVVYTLETVSLGINLSSLLRLVPPGRGGGTNIG